MPGGKASPGPPIGPALGPLGINIKAVVDDINAKTASYNGMQVPVKVIVDDKKNVTLEIGIPPASALVLIEAGIEKGSSGEEGTVWQYQRRSSDQDSKNETTELAFVQAEKHRQRNFGHLSIDGRYRRRKTSQRCSKGDRRRRIRRSVYRGMNSGERLK